jgi:hypothetical protein
LIVRHGEFHCRGDARVFLMWHPAALLLAWLCFALALQWLSLIPVLLLAVACLFMAGVIASGRVRRLLLRVRWLLLALFAILLFMTPGEYLSGVLGDIGLTKEGVRVAGEQIARLLALLASLALLHDYLGTHGLLEGLYALMGDTPWREKTVVRLLLVLEFAEQERPLPWRDWLEECHDDSSQDEIFKLRAVPMGRHDKLLVAGALILGMLTVAFS